MMSETGLAAPVLLLAMPQVVDPFFQRSVVLLLHHTDEGSFGFIVNRPTELLLGDILEGMELQWHGSADSLAFFGGPVQSQMGTVMFTNAVTETLSLDELIDATEVCPGVHVSQQLEDLGRLAQKPPPQFRLFLGYAGWGAGQLVEEIVRNDWLTAPVRQDFIFSTHPETVWEEALLSVGVDPAVMPAWTPEAKEEAN